MLEILTAVVSLLAFSLAVWTALGFLRLRRGVESRLARNFSLCLIILGGSYAGRSVLWNMILPVIDPEQKFYEAGGLAINLVWDALVIIGVYYGLRALHLTLPEQEQRHWTWLTAPLYPRFGRTSMRRSDDGRDE